MNFKKMLALVIINMIILAPTVVIYAQEGEDLPFVFEEVRDVEEVVSEESADAGEASELEAAPAAPTAAQGEDVSGNVTLDFKDADIKNVLRILSYKGGVNIVAGKGVEGPVTIRLTDVPWEKAMEVLLKTYDYGYEKDGNIITVTPMEVLTKKKLAELELAEVEPLITEIFNLEFVDASDAMAVVSEQLSPRGKVTVFKKTVQKGWPFGAGGGTSSSSDSGVGGFGVIEREDEQPRAKTLVVTDISSYMDRVKKIIAEIDIMPKQVLIETRIVEVNRDRLKDLGFDWGTGSSGAETDTVSLLDASGKNESKIGGQVLSSAVAPSIFDPKATGIDSTFGFDSGFSLVFKKLTGLQFEVILHALEEDVESNTLSAPRIMTLDNQEAKILIGDSRPIIKSEVSSSENSSGVTQTLDYYQNLGIVLNVIPQVSADDYINLVVHPAVYSTTDSVTATSTISGGTNVTTNYPIVLMREADTQILLKSGETAVIGGLLKDIKKESVFSVPILGDLPLVGFLFRRETTDIEKVDLLIFLTARVVEEGEAGLTDYGMSMIVEDEVTDTEAAEEASEEEAIIGEDILKKLEE